MEINKDKNMSDLIRRQDAVSRISDLLMLELQGKRLPTWNEVYNAIDDIPSAKTERKKGKWVGDCCSCCGVSKYNYIKMVDDECRPFGTWNFCPNCGADMRGE